MEEPQTAAAFLAAVERAYQEWQSLLVEVREERMDAPGVAGQESLKDIIAHVTWYEREMVEVVRARALEGSDLWALPTDERNAAIFAANQDRPLADVLREAREVHEQLVAALATLTDADLRDAGRFRDMPGDWRPGAVIASNTYEHYPEHIPAIRAWLNRRPN